MPCSQCGGPLPAAARFCPTCAAPVAEIGPGEERKVATVLFADLASSTELGGSLARAGTYLEPFALRALGTVRDDPGLLARATACFPTLGLRGHCEGAPARAPAS